MQMGLAICHHCLVQMRGPEYYQLNSVGKDVICQTWMAEILRRVSLRVCADTLGGKGAVSTAGREYFEDLCMKAVNQCIGRVIRHKGDWAAILLVDQRWTSDTSAGKHPTPPSYTQAMLSCI